MAKDDAEQDQITIAVPLRRLLTGVPRPARAPAAVPRIKHFVLRHIDPDWRDAIWDEDRGVHRVWIDDFLNKAIWSRGREHVGGPTEWMEAAAGQKPRLSRRTTSRYGSVLKVKALFVEEPRDGGDARLEVYLYGYDDLAQEKDEKDDEDEKETKGEKEDEEEDEAPEEDEGEEDEEEAEAKEAAPEEKPAPKPEAKAPAKKPASASAAAKSIKPAAKPETK